MFQVNSSGKAMDVFFSLPRPLHGVFSMPLRYRKSHFEHALGNHFPGLFSKFATEGMLKLMHRRAAIGPSTPVGTPWRRGMFQAVKRGANQ